MHVTINGPMTTIGFEPGEVHLYKPERRIAIVNKDGNTTYVRQINYQEVPNMVLSGPVNETHVEQITLPTVVAAMYGFT